MMRSACFALALLAGVQASNWVITDDNGHALKDIEIDDLNAFHGPSCTEASLRVLGLSFAGWNVIASLILAAIAFLGASRKPA